MSNEDRRSIHPTDQTSLSLLERVRLCDEAAWRRLLDLYSPLVYAWCRRSGLDAEDAGDVVQETFLAVSGSLPRFRRDGPGDTFRGWLRVIARNKIRDLFRKNHRRGRATGGGTARQQLEQLPDALDDEPDEAGAAEEKQIVMRRALELVRGEFEPVTWQAFHRVVVEGRSAVDAAHDLGMTAGAVRQAKYRVLRRLREELGELLD